LAGWTPPPIHEIRLAAALSTGLMPVSFETIVGWSRATSVGASGRLIDLM
jgi:hypothetical protein